MSNKKEDDSFSTAKTNSSSINKDTSSKNEEDELAIQIAQNIKNEEKKKKIWLKQEPEEELNIK